MSWAVCVVVVVAMVCAASLAAWWMWLVHDAEPE